jgi:hypothetical protein
MSQERVVAIAADYADALLVTRRAQRSILLVLLLILLSQIGLFAVAHFTDLLKAGTVATQPAVNWSDWLGYATQASLYLAMIFGLLLVAVLFVTIHIMLVGRLIGVSYVTRAFTLAILLLLLLFPWQTILVTSELTKGDFVFPGVLFTWREVQGRVLGAHPTDMASQVLYWGRFVVMPLVAVVMLLVVQVRSGRGLKLALGEEELLPPPIDEVPHGR